MQISWAALHTTYVHIHYIHALVRDRLTSTYQCICIHLHVHMHMYEEEMAWSFEGACKRCMPPCMNNLDALSDCNSGDAPHPAETLSWSDPTVSHVTKGVALREKKSGEH